jgi:hypothetical protein
MVHTLIIHYVGPIMCNQHCNETDFVMMGTPAQQAVF